MKVFVPIIAVSALLASTVSGWSAGESQGSLSVAITIKPECMLTTIAPKLEFDSPVLAALNKDVTNVTKLKVLCTEGSTYESITLGKGQNSTGTNRRMANGNDTMEYKLYQDVDHTKLWENDVAVTSPPGKSSKFYRGQEMEISIYGVVPQEEVRGAPAGTYRDTVAVTVKF